MKKVIEITSLEQTQKLAEYLAEKAFPGMVITLEGDLGAGKTTFTKAFGKALKVKETINSPTFTILKIYQGRLPLYHMDVYRMEGITQELGFEEYIEGDGVCVIEWAQYIKEMLPNAYLQIQIFQKGEQLREFHIQGSNKYEQIVRDIA